MASACGSRLDPAPELHTRRLTLRPIGHGDTAAILRLHGDPRVTDQLIDGVPASIADVQAMLRWNEPLTDQGIGTFAVRRRDAHGVIGLFSLTPFESDPALLEFGGRLEPAAWKGGLSLEAGAAMIDHALLTLGRSSLVSACHPANRAAQAALGLLGFAGAHPIRHFGREAVALTLTAVDWPMSAYCRKRASRCDYGGGAGPLA